MSPALRPAARRQRALRPRRRSAAAGLVRLLAWTVVLLAFLSLVWVVVLRFVNPPATWIMLRDRLAGIEVEHRPVRLDQISPALRRAVLAGEDSRFCVHAGFDTAALSDAWADTRAGRLRGGSTISQQTAKNVFLWPERSWLRKGLEAWFTVLIEALWGKERILEVYLNVAEFGRGIYGAEAAARHHFGVSASELSPQQAGRLAAVLPSPRRRNAGEPGPFVRRHGATLEARGRALVRDGLASCVI